MTKIPGERKPVGQVRVRFFSNGFVWVGNRVPGIDRNIKVNQLAARIASLNGLHYIEVRVINIISACYVAGVNAQVKVYG